MSTQCAVRGRLNCHPPPLLVRIRGRKVSRVSSLSGSSTTVLEMEYVPPEIKAAAQWFLVRCVCSHTHVSAFSLLSGVALFRKVHYIVLRGPMLSASIVSLLSPRFRSSEFLHAPPPSSLPGGAQESSSPPLHTGKVFLPPPLVANSLHPSRRHLPLGFFLRPATIKTRSGRASTSIRSSALLRPSQPVPSVCH